MSGSRSRIVDSKRDDGVVFRVVGKKGRVTCGMVPDITRVDKVGRLRVSSSVLIRRVRPKGKIGCATAIATKGHVGANATAFQLTIASAHKRVCSRGRFALGATH